MYMSICVCVHVHVSFWYLNSNIFFLISVFSLNYTTEPRPRHVTLFFCWFWFCNDVFLTAFDLSLDVNQVLDDLKYTVVQEGEAI